MKVHGSSGRRLTFSLNAWLDMLAVNRAFAGLAERTDRLFR
jgi:hypothetical protein